MNGGLTDTGFAVSVIITTHNRANLVGETIEAVLAQTLRPVEIIVVDDGSTDGTADLLRRYPVIHHRIKNVGLNMARAAGFAISKGDWIACCDDDDLWRPHYLETMSHHLGDRVRFGFSNHVKIYDGVWGTEEKFSDAPTSYFETIGDSFYPHLLQWVPMLPSTTIISADLLHQAGGFDPDFGRGCSQDWELELRCVQYSPVVAVHEPLVGIRRHSGNRTRTHLPSLLGDLRALTFARERHPFAKRYRAEIDARYVQKVKEAFGAAFAEGRPDLVSQLFPELPSEQRGWKELAKRAACTVPFSALLIRATFS